VRSKPITVDVILTGGTGTVLAQTQFNAVQPTQSNGIQNTPIGATEFMSCVFFDFKKREDGHRPRDGHRKGPTFLSLHALRLLPAPLRRTTT
jgi:hypothetical protein